MQKALKIFSALMFVLIALVAVLFFSNSESEKMIDVILYFGYILLALSAILALVLPLPLLLQYPKKIKKMLLTIVLVIIVCVAGYLLASGAPIEGLMIETPPSAQTLKLTDTALIITYLMLGASILVIIGGGIKSIIQNRK